MIFAEKGAEQKISICIVLLSNLIQLIEHLKWAMITLACKQISYTRVLQQRHLKNKYGMLYGQREADQYITNGYLFSQREPFD